MSQTLKLKIENEKICFDRLDSFSMNVIVIQGVFCAKFMIVNGEVQKINHCKKKRELFSLLQSTVKVSLVICGGYVPTIFRQ